MSNVPAIEGTALPDQPSALRRSAAMLWADKFALAAAIFLLLVVVMALLGPAWLSEVAQKQNLRGRNAPPFYWERGLLWVLGADSLGRPLLARIIVAAQNTILVAAGAVLFSALVGTSLGLVAGYASRRIGEAIMRPADVAMSFPSLLLAVIALQVLAPSVANLVVVLAISRIPIHLRTTRAEVLGVRERVTVSAARDGRLAPADRAAPHPARGAAHADDHRHACAMLAEPSLPVLGIGIQPPEITLELVVSQGRQYLTNAHLEELQAETGMGIITRDLGVVAEIADSVVAMNGGEVVATGDTREVCRNPRHPYTRKLIGAAPDRDEMRAPLARSEPVLRVRDVTEAFGRFMALDGVGFDLMAGETRSVLGVGVGQVHARPRPPVS